MRPDFDVDSFLRGLTGRPGVYRMLGADDEVLYVGKAKNLRKRVSTYFRKSGLGIKTAALMSQVERVEVTVTHTEAEALLLENNLIKELRPRYNVLLRDDKSYPWIHVSTDQAFPRLAFHRGARTGGGRYFGPYPSAHAVRETLRLLQKMFRVRQCEDSFFRNRSRPCLQYQIKRCSAPCVGLVSADAYAEDLRHTLMFLEGKSSELQDELVARMEAAAARLDYEQAAHYRDQIRQVQRVCERQYISGEGGDLDIVAAAVQGGRACVQVFFVRSGRSLGNKTFFPKGPDSANVPEVLSAFVSQFYPAHEVPGEILLNAPIEEVDLLETVLSERAGRRVRIRHSVRGERARRVQLAQANAEQALATRLASRAGMAERLEAVQQVLDLAEPPARIECFDISHTQGEATVASCVVFNREGPLKSDYRRFNIRDIEPGDDYAAMAQALSRRYTRLQKGEGALPDVLLIDGGKGQTAVAVQVLEELQVDGVQVVGIAKGPERRPGWETLHVVGQGELHLPPDSPALHLIQQVRDEAHRFAVTGHRQRRGKARTQSLLESIPGVGPRRRQQLLQQFGGMQEVARAGVEDLARVKGISRALAQRIYDVFHGD